MIFKYLISFRNLIAFSSLIRILITLLFFLIVLFPVSPSNAQDSYKELKKQSTPGSKILGVTSEPSESSGSERKIEATEVRVLVIKALVAQTSFAPFSFQTKNSNSVADAYDNYINSSKKMLDNLATLLDNLEGFQVEFQGTEWPSAKLFHTDYRAKLNTRGSAEFYKGHKAELNTWGSAEFYTAHKAELNTWPSAKFYTWDRAKFYTWDSAKWSFITSKKQLVKSDSTGMNFTVYDLLYKPMIMLPVENWIKTNVNPEIMQLPKYKNSVYKKPLTLQEIESVIEKSSLLGKYPNMAVTLSASILKDMLKMSNQDSYMVVWPHIGKPEAIVSWGSRKYKTRPTVAISGPSLVKLMSYKDLVSSSTD